MEQVGVSTRLLFLLSCEGVDGRVVGGWAQQPDGHVVTSLFEDVGADARRAVNAEAAAVESWLATSRVIPRFRTPLEFELSAGG